MMDSILFWNAVALEANRVSHSDPDKREQNGPTLSSRALAIVHLAMYDAYAGITGAGFPRYLQPPNQPAPVGASARDAVAGAAYTTLVALYKTQKEYFDGELSAFETNVPVNIPSTTSFDFGAEVGNAILALRANDPDNRSAGYPASRDRYRHRVDPDNPGQGFDSPFYGAQSKGFAVQNRHKLNTPPKGNTDYLKALQQVRARGIKPELMATLPDKSGSPNFNLFAHRRNAPETTVGIFWAYDGSNRLGTPPRFYNQIIRKLAAEKGNTEGVNARLFAFLNAALGDAGIMAWEQKYCHDLWRPVVGIREHDASLGPSAPYTENFRFDDGDPFWLPLGAPATNSPTMKNSTPGFPSYPSGHATFGAAAFHIVRLFNLCRHCKTSE